MVVWVEMLESIRLAFESQSRPSKRLAYGTAGFRDKENLPLDSTFIRMGILACLRSWSVGGRPVGIMITASHNAVCDNGIKLVDFDGGMLAQAWEPYAELLANSDSWGDFNSNIEIIAEKESIDLTSLPLAVVIFGRDTRPHSNRLSDCVQLGLSSCGAKAFNLGEVTTPQVHFVVQRLHIKFLSSSVELLSINDDFVRATALEYFSILSNAFNELMTNVDVVDAQRGRVELLVVDAAHGVGSLTLDEMIGSLSRDPKVFVEFDVRNRCGQSFNVNDSCGAELVQKSVVPPRGVDSVSDKGKLICSFDGDADRIVFHSFIDSEAPNWILLDGDKIASLVSLMLARELAVLGQIDSSSESFGSQFSIGVVQSAYANGASTAFFRSQGIPVVMAKTGVKYMHHKALQFDLGVYFEANGHGTVIFSEKLLSWLEAQILLVGDSTFSFANRRSLAIRRLHAASRLINQAVGDAISDMLLVLSSLQILQISVVDWSSLYVDLPSKMIKFPVPDKSAVVCNEDETRALEPAALQPLLDEAMARIEFGRCFVRPSGTEDVVRVYAEAATPSLVDELIQVSSAAIKMILG